MVSDYETEYRIYVTPDWQLLDFEAGDDRDYTIHFRVENIARRLR
jgi:hypothetical protein